MHIVYHIVCLPQIPSGATTWSLLGSTAMLATPKPKLKAAQSKEPTATWSWYTPKCWWNILGIQSKSSFLLGYWLWLT